MRREYGSEWSEDHVVKVDRFESVTKSYHNLTIFLKGPATIDGLLMKSRHTDRPQRGEGAVSEEDGLPRRAFS